MQSLLTREKLLSAAYVIVVIVGALLLTTLLHLPHGPEHWSADLRTAHLSPRLKSQYDKIALVYISDKTLDRFPYISPTDRGLIAELVRKIDAAGAAVIGLDFILDRATEPAKDDALIDAIRKARAEIVLGTIGATAHKTEKEAAFEADILARSGRPSGHIFFGEHHSALVISDNVVRTTYEDAVDTGKPSFAAVLAREAGANAVPQSRYISWLKQPEDGSDTFMTLTAESVLDPGALPLAELLKDRIVLVGGNFFDRDQHLTPFSVITHHRYPGLSIHAQMLAQLLDNRSLVLPSWHWQLLLIALAATLGYWSGRGSGSKYLFVELATVAMLIGLGVLAFVVGNVIFPYTGTLLAWLGGAAGGHYGRRANH
jgi:adenylate cyclase